MRNAPNPAVAAIIIATILIAANTLLAQDDWVQVPSPSSSSSDSQPAHPSNSQDAATPITAHPQRGDDNAAVTIVEYSDYQCPYCRQQEAALRQVMKRDGNQVRLVYMDFPLPFHQHAMDAAMAARCADEQGQFWPYHDALFDSSSSLSTPELKTTAAQLGLDPDTFNACLDGRKYEHAVLADRLQGEREGARGTPYLVIGRHSMFGAQSSSALESAIDEQLLSRGSLPNAVPASGHLR